MNDRYSTKRGYGAWLMATLCLLISGCASLRGDRPEDPISIAGLLTQARDQGKPLHILYVHGMNAHQSGESDDFQRRLWAYLSIESPMPEATTRVLNAGNRPTGAEYGSDIWDTDEKWVRSQPFARRRVHQASRVTVVVDEINWWPLLVPIKCSRLIAGELPLTGTDKLHLDICSRDQSSTGDPYYPWLKITDPGKPRMPPAPLNAALKRNLMTWGLSDAVLSLGPLRERLRNTFEQAFGFISEPPPGVRAGEQTYALIAESLGSYVVLDTYNVKRARIAQDPGIKLGYVYLLANQFALLDLGRTPVVEPAPSAAAGTVQHSNGVLQEWVRGQARSGFRIQGKDANTAAQIVAYSDPSDILTYDVPDIVGADVFNYSVRNATRWVWLFANPIDAHTGHLSNKAVLEHLFQE